ncbi:MAG: cbb3-type cytochrome c oxidase subunit 3 [Geminicoccaceae bacterium]|nr:cbb3-type cytochrome c oxidase subunit 3 [Geminicoccaceae bacterium]
MYETIRPHLQALWELWLFLLFIGIVAWVFWPGRRKKMEEHGRIPFETDEKSPTTPPRREERN